MKMGFSISVQAGDFDVNQEYLALVPGDASAGASVFFVGLVRDFSNGKDIKGMLLEHYPGMTEKILNELLTDARQRWQLLSGRIVHRIGSLNAGEQIVFVGVTSAHREHAFRAAEFLMDYLKTRAPFWKKEFGQTGEGAWVEAKEADSAAASRWNEAGK